MIANPEFHLCPFQSRRSWSAVGKTRFCMTHALSASQNASWSPGDETRAWLVATSGSHLGEDFRLTEGRNLIGTGVDSHITLTSPKISQSHAAITCDSEGRCVIEDLSSSHGTFVNNEKVTSHALCDHDEIRLGLLTLLFKGVKRREPGDKYPPPPPSARNLANAQKRMRLVRGWLVGISGEHRGQDFRLRSGENIIGGMPDLDVVLMDSEIRQKHCVITFDKTWHVVAHEHDAIVRVNGKDVKVSPLRDADLITIGSGEFYLKCL